MEFPSLTNDPECDYFSLFKRRENSKVFLMTMNCKLEYLFDIVPVF